MARYFSRAECLSRLRAERAQGRPLLLWGAGSGLSAKSAVQGGADLIAVYSTAILRMRGLPSLLSSLPYFDSNNLLLEASGEILPLVNNTPLLAGVGAHNPLLNIGKFLEDLKAMGYSGVANEPFASNYGDSFAAQMEESGLGFSREVELICRAREKGMLTLAWCCNTAEAAAMAEAGADLIGAMVLYGPRKLDNRREKHRFQDSLDTAAALAAAARAARPDVLVLTHGSPFMDAKTARLSIQKAGADGYAAGSSGERISAQEGMAAAARQYKNMIKTKSAYYPGQTSLSL